MENCYTLEQTIRYCEKMRFSRYRIPSNIFPLISHPEINLRLSDLLNFQEIKDRLAVIGDFATNREIGLSFHPSQFDVLASESISVSSAAAVDINNNAEILDLLKTPQSCESPINIHMGRNPKNLSDFKQNFLYGFSQLTNSAKNRLTIENEDRGFWNIINLSDFLSNIKQTEKIEIPLTLDFHHHFINQCGISQEQAFKIAYKTWKNHIPVFHYSESDKTKGKRAHSEFLRNPPPYFGVPYYCMIEAKGKDFAILKLRDIEKV